MNFTSFVVSFKYISESNIQLDVCLEKSPFGTKSSGMYVRYKMTNTVVEVKVQVIRVGEPSRSEVGL